MEEYDVLCNFRDLKTIFKNIPVEPLDPAPLTLEETLNDSDILLDARPSISSNKSKNSSKKRESSKIAKKNSVKSSVNASKAEVEAVVEQTANNSNMCDQTNGTRRRRSLRSLHNCLSENAILNSTVNNTTKSSRGRGRKSTDSCAEIPQATVTKKSTRGRGKRTAENTATLAGFYAEKTLCTQNPMRSRQKIADFASRCQTIDIVDLCASPKVRVEGSINLIDDEEPNTSAAKLKQQHSLDISFDEENPEMSVKIKWEFKLKTFQLRKYQKFVTIFEELAKEHNIEVNQIVLNLNNQFIKPNDTPASINYKLFQFIEGRTMEVNELGDAGVIQKDKRDKNVIKLKLQTNKHKKPLLIDLGKTETFRTLVIKCAEELKIPHQNIIKLCFDGDIVDTKQTPADLELGGGEIMEVYLKN